MPHHLHQPHLITQPPQLKPRTKMKTTTMIVSSDSNLEDVVRAPLNWQLVEQTIGQLQKASDDLVQLYKRISLDYEMEDSDRAKMLQKLAFMAGASQQTLKPVNPNASLEHHKQQNLAYAQQHSNFGGNSNFGGKNPGASGASGSTANLHQGPSWC